MNWLWTFHDPDGTLPDWTFPVNPNAMDAPEIGHDIVISPWNIDGSSAPRETPTSPSQWSFGGVLYTLDHHDTLEAWLENGRPIVLTDHYGRAWKIQLVSVDTQRGGTRRHPQRHTYTAQALMLDGAS